jgi:hypothetical protein
MEQRTIPTVILVDGFAVRVYMVEDGEGPHVHVVKGGREYRVRLLEDEVALMTFGGREKVTRAEACRAVAIVKANLAARWEEWKKWHE